VLGCDESESSIPFWLVEGDLSAPYESPTSSLDCDRIVAVCSCGELGCGGTTARVSKYLDVVMFSDFKPSSSRKALVFTRTNYDEVHREMTALASQYRARQSG
jgi:hypothetical protein